MAKKTTKSVLSIRNFAQISRTDIQFGDLTVLVGAQGTGKSLALQWLKVAFDGKYLVKQLHQAGHSTRGATLIDLIFGVGMRAGWTTASRVGYEGRPIHPSAIGRRGNETERVFFIPAHRALLMNNGWALPFQSLTPDTPVVARLFSQRMFDMFSAPSIAGRFPLSRTMKPEYRDAINDAIFHDASVVLEQDALHQARRLRLVHGETSLPFMTWTAGQREFTPLLLGLYHLLPPRKLLKQPDIDWVIIEEPEMGLHPQAVSVVLLLVLDLLWRGYKVVLSTHSPHVLTAVWMLQRLKEHRARWQLVCEAFELKSAAALRPVAEAALQKTYRVHALAYDASDSKVHSTEISGLDPDADDPTESGWGGLTGFSSKFGEAVRKAVNEAGR